MSARLGFTRRLALGGAFRWAIRGRGVGGCRGCRRHALGDGAYGFQLRNDDYLPARQAMFSLLRDAFVNDLTVITDYQIDPGKINGIAIRVALIRRLIPSKAPVRSGQPARAARSRAAAGRRRPRVS